MVDGCAAGAAGRFASEGVEAGVPGRATPENDAEVGEGLPLVKGDDLLEAADEGLSIKGRGVMLEEGLADPV